MPGTPPRVGAIVVAHRSSASIGGCIKSILVDASVSAILVIDNAGDPATRAAVSELNAIDPRVNYLDPRKNLGFAGGGNLGAALLPEVDFVCLINPRLQLSTKLSILCLAAQPVYAVWAGAVVKAASGAAMNVKPAATVRRELARVMLGEHGYTPPLRPERVDAIQVSRLNGDLLCLRRSTFEALGGLDESLEHHFADADLCDRAQHKGGVWLVPIEAGQLTERSQHWSGSVQSRQARGVSRVRYLRKVRGDRLATSVVACLLALLEAAIRSAEPDLGWRANRKLLAVELAEIRCPESQWVLRWPGGRTIRGH